MSEKIKETKKENIIYIKNNNKEKKTKTIGTFFLELIKIIVISLAIIIPVRYYLIQPFIVRGSSMEPNFSNGQYLIIDEITYRFQDPVRGDVVVFKYPKDITQYYIKRIIGLSLETVEISGGEIIIYNNKYPEGANISESYLTIDHETPGDLKISVPYNEYFVLGDNRGASSDSRVWGLLPRQDIIGKAWVSGWPPSRFGVIKTPTYELSQ
jgi:signal peptidase I